MALFVIFSVTVCNKSLFAKLAAIWLFSGVDTHVPVQMAATAGFVLAARPIAAMWFLAGVDAQVFTNVPPLQTHTDFTIS